MNKVNNIDDLSNNIKARDSIQSLNKPTTNNYIKDYHHLQPEYTRNKNP
jgi:hypothetical protein